MVSWVGGTGVCKLQQLLTCTPPFATSRLVFTGMSAWPGRSRARLLARGGGTHASAGPVAPSLTTRLHPSSSPCGLPTHDPPRFHMVVNLEESVAVTQNFVSPLGLGAVLAFLRTGTTIPGLVSGCEHR